VNDKWTHVHEIFIRPGEYWAVERCLGDLPRREAAEFFSEESVIEDRTGRTLFKWIEYPEERCWIGRGKAVC
jgi:hypothetical protein